MTMIDVRSIETLGADPNGRRELDRDFLGSGFRRQVFVSADPERCWVRPPYRAHVSLLFVPIPVDTGSCGRLRYELRSGESRSVEMRGGSYYYLPPEVPYQIEAAGRGVLEVFAPAGSPTRLIDEEELPSDYFSARAGEPLAFEEGR